MHSHGMLHLAGFYVWHTERNLHLRKKCVSQAKTHCE